MKLTSHQYRLLAHLGVKNIGDLLRLPRSGLARRMGLKFIHDLDRLIGEKPDPQILFKPQFCFKHSIDFEIEISNTNELMPTIKYLLEKLDQHLTRSCTTIQYLEWHLQHGRSRHSRIPIQLNRLQQRTESLIALSEIAFESSYPIGKIYQLTLYARPFPLSPRNDTSITINKSPLELDELLERLSARLGKSAIKSICCQSNYSPENAWGICEPGTHNSTFTFVKRPLWLFHSPRLMPTKDKRPWFHGSLELSRHERIVTNWWHKTSLQRDYYQAKSNRGIIWIFRDLKTNSWYMHGIF